MKRLAVATFTALLLAGCASTAPLAEGAVPGLSSAPLAASVPSDLPRSARPLHYAIDVVPDAQNLTFAGTEAVTLEAVQRLAVPLRATWVRRAMRNLIENAMRYGEQARVSLGRDGAEAVVRIEDDGPGIPPGEIAAMLEPFARGETSRNRVTGGAGLGLTLARAIAEQHGGRLVLANRTGAGGQIAGLVAELRLPLA